MKKVLATIIVLAMLASLFAVSVSAAEPALLITAEDLTDSGNIFGSCTAELETEGDISFARVTSTGNDPWIVLQPAPSTDAANKYAAIKYRTTADASAINGSFYTLIAEPHADFDLVKDGEWHVSVSDLTVAAAVFGEGAVNTSWNGDFNRVDILNGNPLNADQTIDIAWIALFASEEDALAYDGGASSEQPAGIINEADYDVSYTIDSSNAKTWNDGNIGDKTVKYFFKVEDDGVKVAIRALGANANDYIQLNFNPGNKLWDTTGQFISFVTGDTFKVLQHNHKNGLLDDANPGGADITDKVEGQIAAIDGGYEIVAKLPKALFTITDVDGADAYVYGQDDLYYGMFVVLGGKGFTNQSAAPGTDWNCSGLGLNEYVLRGQVPVTEPETVPATGDMTVAMFAVIAVLAMGAAVVFMKKKSF